MILTKRKLTAWLLPVLLAAALLGLNYEKKDEETA